LDVSPSFHLGIPSIGSGLFDPVVEKLLRQDAPMAQKGSDSMGDAAQDAEVWRGDLARQF
jgi:hypothetical protein